MAVKPEMEIIDSGPRKAWLAAVLALLCVGLGHVYGGRTARGAKLYMLSIASVPVILLGAALPPSTALLAVMVGASFLILPIYLFSLIDAVRIARRRSDGIRLSRWNSLSVYALCVLVGTGAYLTGSLLLPEFAFRAYYVPTGVMSPSIERGDRIFVNQLTYRLRDPKRWEVVVYLSPHARSMTGVMRVIGLPGDRIGSADGRLILNGKPVPGVRGELHGTKEFEETVPAGCYYVLGDRRKYSFDSRSFGFVPADDVLGPVQYVAFPLGRFGSLPTE